MNIKSGVAIVLVGALTVTSGWLVGQMVSGRGPSSDLQAGASDRHASATSPGAVAISASRVDFPDPADRVSSVEIVVIARWTGDSRETVGLPSRADGEVRGERVDVHREFDTVRVLKGGPLTAHFSAVTSASNTTFARPGQHADVLATEPVVLSRGRDYVLFLKELTPEQGSGYGFWGEPGIAAVMGSTLQWSVTDGYRHEMSSRRKPLGTGGAGLAFDITLEQLESLIAAEQKP